jgi:predicted enzyme related to lactoylglutathione lyase
MNARDDSALGQFWAEALGWSVASEEPGVTSVEPQGFVYPDPVAVCIDVLRVPEPKTVKNRVHIDLATTSAAHQAELVARLEDLGATPADVGQGDVPWTVLADPEGNVFCVLEPREIYRDTGPIAAVVVDCADPRATARFWGEAMDWTLHEVTDDHARLRSAKGVGPYLEFLRTRGVKTVWNRIHLDLLPYADDDQAAEVARLRALGATDIDLGQGDVPWTVLADPEGNEFCVLGPGRGALRHPTREHTGRQLRRSTKPDEPVVASGASVWPAAHAAPGALGLVVLIAIVVVVIILSKRGK